MENGRRRAARREGLEGRGRGGPRRWRPASAAKVGIRFSSGRRKDLVPGAARPIPWPGAPAEGVGRTWGAVGAG